MLLFGDRLRELPSCWRIQRPWWKVSFVFLCFIIAPPSCLYCVNSTRESLCAFVAVWLFLRERLPIISPVSFSWGWQKLGNIQMEPTDKSNTSQNAKKLHLLLFKKTLTNVFLGCVFFVCGFFFTWTGMIRCFFIFWNPSNTEKCQLPPIRS